MENIIKLYNDVFDEYYNVKACGRLACQKLIAAFEELQPDVDFGNKETGFMNIQNILLFRQTISCESCNNFIHDGYSCSIKKVEEYPFDCSCNTYMRACNRYEPKNK